MNDMRKLMEAVNYEPDLEDDAEVIADYVVQLQQNGMSKPAIVAAVRRKYGQRAATEVSDGFEEEGELGDWNQMNEGAGTTLRVPEFTSGAEAESFLASLNPDDTVNRDVTNPETGEVLFEPGQTKRDVYSNIASKRQNMEPIVPPMYGGRNEEEAWECLHNLRQSNFYNVAWRSIADMVDSPDRMADKGYEVDMDIPVAIKRKDGQRFTDDDHDNFREIKRAVQKASTMQNIGLEYLGSSHGGTVARFLPSFL